MEPQPLDRDLQYLQQRITLDATMEGVALDQPNGISKLCLSCHDGTIAIGTVRNRSGSGGFGAAAIGMNGVELDGSMPVGPYGENTGFTRRLGTDLSNDHPISFTYDTALASRDGELRDPAGEIEISNRSPGVSPHIPLDNGQVQCNSCHDPHIRDETDPTKNIKFLRLNRFQRVSPTSTAFSEPNDIICLACHDKAGWVGSAHATDIVANEVYTNAAAALHEFPLNTQVWQAACLACHDTHTVQGSRRLLREGVDGPVGVSGEKLGGNAAIEETCFACHSADGGTLVGQGTALFEVPDIKTDFNLPIHMPIRNSEQFAGLEMHDIGSVRQDTQETAQRGKDFIESQASLGKISMGGSLLNRHVECTDCHNPHRVTKRRLFTDNNLGGIMDAAGTHNHDNATPHTNIASGVLRGMWGVEPVYVSNSFHVGPISFTLKRGDPGGNLATDVTQPYMTREYQVCLKCHSTYGYDIPPLLGASASTTPSGVNHMTRYTDQGKEFNSPATHAGEPLNVGTDGGAGNNNGFTWNTNNHRSWHPVRAPTGRFPGARTASNQNWTNPFSNAVGAQTMYCSDCHGSATAIGTVDPDPGQEDGAVWGPHGSTNYFLLKGDWSGNSLNPEGTAPSPQNDFTNRPGTGDRDFGNDPTTHLCFKCHKFEQYAATTGAAQGSGFGGDRVDGAGINYHRFHVDLVTNYRCNLCHVAVPHGWKNKTFLVNLNDVGEEAGFPAGSSNEVRNNTRTGFVAGPYYNRAALKIRNFAASGFWLPNNCGSIGVSGNGRRGVTWMADSNEACANVP